MTAPYKYELKCPFYEEHGGEYYQGCWEFTDMCYAAPTLDTPHICTRGCPLITGNEEQMLQNIYESYHMPRKVYAMDGSVDFRALTEWEKDDIIEVLGEMMEVQNTRKKGISFYK